MTPEKIYQELKDLADKLQVTVTEKSFRNIGIAVSSGFCIVRNENRCIMDKRLKLHRKIEVLAECLAGMPHEDVYVVPAVRELMERHRPVAAATSKAAETDSGDGETQTDIEAVAPMVRVADTQQPPDET